MHHLIVQLQSRYPTSSLISELLTVHDGNYVVRALVQVGGTTLATGMAAASSIEAAEDRAKVRVLEALGIVPSPIGLLDSSLLVSPEKPVSPGKPVQSAASTADLTFPSVQPSQVGSEAIARDGELAIASSSSSNPVPKTATLPNAAVSLELDSEFTSEFTIDNTDFYLSDPGVDELPEDYFPPEPEVQEEPLQVSDFAPTPKPTSSRPTQNGKTNTEPDSTEAVTPAPNESIDNSDVIAQTDVELRRLGWGREQGRKHLEQTYGKRSRQQLTDAELLDFLHHLESQP